MMPSRLTRWAWPGPPPPLTTEQRVQRYERWMRGHRRDARSFGVASYVFFALVLAGAIWWRATNGQEFPLFMTAAAVILWLGAAFISMSSNLEWYRLKDRVAEIRAQEG